MAVIGDFDPEEFQGVYRGPGDDDRARVLAEIQSLHSKWIVPVDTVVMGDVSWRPDLVAPKQQLLHLALTGDIPRALMRRMQAAQKHGYQVTVGLGSHRLDLGTLLALQELNARIVAVDWDEEQTSVRGHRSVADWIATERISLSPADLRCLAAARLGIAETEATNERGRLYEEVLCLVFSQVPWLTVDEHAYRNESEEIDLVLGVHATGHIAELAKGAVAIATAKNENKATGSATVKYLKEQMANRKGRCRLGFLCSATSISPAAKTEILRGSQSSDVVIAQVDREDLLALLADSEHLDHGVQALIRRAIDS
jgi:hypothetical protein